MFTNEDFITRLYTLRMQHNVSAREMSLDIGQNPAYINNIENGKSMPSMNGFFEICDYFKITPKDFFDYDIKAPEKLQHLIKYQQNMSSESIEALTKFFETL